MPEERAINPYNFIPFGLEPNRKALDEYYQEPLESGWIDVILTVKTPLIIPDASHPHTKTITVTARGQTVPREHKSYDFFHLPSGEKTIPGSTLRGMVRSIFEMASNSCVPFVQESPITTRGVTYSSFKKRGLLNYDPVAKCWELYEASVCSYKTTKDDVKRGTFRGFKNASRVLFSSDGGELLPDSLEDISENKTADGKQEGVLQFNIPITNNEYNVAVLTPNTSPLMRWKLNGSASDVDDQHNPYQMLYAGVYDTLNNIREDQKKKKARGLDSPGADLPMETLKLTLESAAKDGGMVPCYYLEVARGKQKLYYLSPASIGRVRQRRSWSEIMGAYSPCTDLDVDSESGKKGVCSACAMFGTATAKRQEDLTNKNTVSFGAGGRLRFTDAKPEAGVSIHTKSYTLPILATPNPSAFDFYLRKPNDRADFWNFDYYGTKEESGGANYYDLEKASPRGRKMYWHSDCKTVELKKLERPDLCNTMEAAEPGSVFRFRIYYDRITTRQRQDLLWVLELGDNQTDSPFQHKLGHAKPYGYGSVKLTVERCIRREIQNGEKTTIRLESLPTEPESVSFDKNSIAIRSLLQMCDTRVTENIPVEYPLGKKDRDPDWTIYTWFVHNRTNPNYTLVLPEPTDNRAKLAVTTMRTAANTGLQQTILTQKKLDELLQEEEKAEKANEEIEQAKALYPIGKELQTTIQKVITKPNHGRLFANLDGTPFQITAEYMPGKKRRYSQGQTVRLRIIGLGQNKEGYPNFVAEVLDK